MRRPQHWSEWLLAAALVIVAARVLWGCWLYSLAITADGGGSFWVGAVRDFRALTGWW